MAVTPLRMWDLVHSSVCRASGPVLSAAAPQTRKSVVSRTEMRVCRRGMSGVRERLRDAARRGPS